MRRHPCWHSYTDIHADIHILTSMLTSRHIIQLPVYYPFPRLVFVQGSPYRDPISMSILRLQETGRLQMLYNKWWRNAGSCASDEKSKEKKANSLGVANVGGIFLVLAVGLAFAVVVGIVEFVWNAATEPRIRKSSPQVLRHHHWREWMNEWMNECAHSNDSYSQWACMMSLNHYHVSC